MVQMHVALDPDLSQKAAHYMTLDAEKRVLKAIPHADIMIHADPRGAAEPHGGPLASARPTGPGPVKAEPNAPQPDQRDAPDAPSKRVGPWS